MGWNFWDDNRGKSERKARKKKKEAKRRAKQAARDAERRARNQARQAQDAAEAQRAQIAQQMRIQQEAMARQAEQSRQMNLQILQQAQNERRSMMDENRRAAAASEARESARLRAVELQAERDKHGARVAAANRLSEAGQANVDMQGQLPVDDLGGTTQFRRRKQQFKTKGAGYTGLSIKSGSSAPGSAQNKMVNV